MRQIGWQDVRSGQPVIRNSGLIMMQYLPAPGAPEDPPREAAPGHWPPPGAPGPPRRLLSRTATLSPESRNALVTHTVTEVQLFVSPPPPPGTHPEYFLAAVAAERRRRDEHRLWREADLRWRLTNR